MTAIRNTMLALGMLLFLPACAPTQEGPGADDAAPEVAPEAAEWTLYRSPSHGYALWYPSTWIPDDTAAEGPPLRIESPDWEAVFIVSSLGDQRLAEQGGLDAVLADIRAGFDQDARYSLEGYEEQREENGTFAGMYIARGGFTDDGTEYRFKEIGDLLRDGRIFVSTAHVRSSSTARYGEILDEMIGGFDALGVGGEKPAMAVE